MRQQALAYKRLLVRLPVVAPTECIMVKAYSGGYMRRILISFALALSLAGCDKAAVQCTADGAKEPVVGIVKEQLEKGVLNRLRSENGGSGISLSKIRAAIAQLSISIDDIRTSKEDPNSTKRFCVGTLKLRFPTATLDDANATRSAAGLNDVSDLAADNDVEQNADTFDTEIEFNIQPTDDGKKIFAETESGNNMFSVASEITSAALMRTAVEDAQRTRQQEADQQAAAQQAALAEQSAANFESAKTDNQIANQTLTAIWNSLSSTTRTDLLPVQRAWIRKKDADCQVEAASSSTDPFEMAAAKLRCDTRAANERSGSLRQYQTEMETDLPKNEEDAAMMQ